MTLTRCTGSQPFGSLDLFVASPTLIPRPETEEWAIWLVGALRATQHDKAEPSHRPKRILDLCTGSGCIPLLLCSELPHGTIKALGVDISSAAITLASRNRDKHAHASPCSQQRNHFEVLQSDIFSPQFMKVLRDHPLYPFDIITSNPPYISRFQFERLPRSVKSYEDSLALIGEAPISHHPTVALTDRSKVNTEGLAFYRRISGLLESDESLIQPGGDVVLEVGVCQAPAVKELLGKALRGRLDFVDIRRDAAGIERVVHAKLR
jgi:release factor glutamine methyltransferase